MDSKAVWRMGKAFLKVKFKGLERLLLLGALPYQGPTGPYQERKLCGASMWPEMGDGPRPGLPYSGTLLEQPVLTQVATAQAKQTAGRHAREGSRR